MCHAHSSEEKKDGSKLKITEEGHPRADRLQARARVVVMTGALIGGSPPLVIQT